MKKSTAISNLASAAKSLLLPLLLAGILGSSAAAQSPPENEKPAAPAIAPAPGPTVASHSAAASPPPISTTVPNAHQATLLRRLWGIDDVHLRVVASGAMIRFSYRVVDAEKAKLLNDKKLNPAMIVDKTGAKLGVPTEENVGQLRQTATPQNGREYWMVFGNAGRMVQAGDRVDIVIGTFRANQLVVEPALPGKR